MEACIKELKKGRAAGVCQRKRLPLLKRERPLLLSEKLYRMLQAHLKKDQITPTVFQHLETYNIHHCLLPSNTTDRLQPMDLTMNKPVKMFFEEEV